MIMKKSLKNRWLNKNIFGMGLASLFGDWCYEMVSAILPAFLSSVLGAPAFALGIIEGVADGISTIFEVFGGWYSDKIGKRKGIVAIGYFIIAISKASFAFMTNWWQLLIGRTTGWIGWSIKSPPRDALLVESASSKTISRVFAFHRIMDTIGAILGPLTATLLLLHFKIRSIFLVAFIPGICAFFSIILFVKEKAKTPIIKNTWESINDLSTSFFKFLIPVGLFGISNFAPTLLILRAYHLLSTSYGTVYASSISVGLYTLSNIVYAFVGYPVGILADKYNKKGILSLGYLLFGLTCFGFILDFAKHLWFLVVLFAINGVYTSIIESTQPALASTLINETKLGTGFGLMSSVDGIGDFLSSILVGLLWTYFSVTVGFGFAGLLAIISSCILIFSKECCKV